MAKKYKKNNRRSLPRFGSTVAVAVAMTMALSSQANAEELDKTEYNPASDLPVPATVSADSSVLEKDVLPEANEAVEQVNDETVAENNAVAEDNEQVEQDNNEAADLNEQNTDGALADPNLSLPDAPQAPDTDGLDAEGYNEAVGEYNENVEDYNEAVDGYNEAVDSYNEAADAYDQEAQEKYEEEKKQYEEDKAAHEESVQNFQEASEQHQQEKEEYDQYLKDLEEYNTLQKEYEEKLAQYEGEKAEHDQNTAEYEQYLKDQEAYDAQQKEYEEKQAQYEEDKAAHEQNTAEYEQYLKDLEAYDAQQKEYEEKQAQYEEDKAVHDQNTAEYEQYLKKMEEYDTLQKEYEQKLAQYESEKAEYDQNASDYEQYLKDLADYTAQLEEYKQKLAQYEGEKAEYDQNASDYDQYLKDLEDYTTQLGEYEEKLAQYERDSDQYEQLVDENTIYDEVTDYNGQVELDNNQIRDMNQALENALHAEFVENIGAVGDINKNVVVDQGVLETLGNYDELADQHGALMQAAADLEAHAGKNADLGSAEYAQYLAAVEAYNEDVEKFNQAAEEYNDAVEIYNAAVETYNANKPATPSNPTTGNGTQQGSANIDWGNVSFNHRHDNIPGEHLTHMDVKYNAAASKEVTVEVDSEGNETPKYSDTVNQYTVTGVYKDKDSVNGGYSLYYSNDGWETREEQSLKKDNANDEFGNTSWSHTGENLDPVNGQISFYVTLKDGAGLTHGITVNMDAGSVYAEGSYYKAESNDFLKDYVGKDNKKLEVVNIDGVDYYDVSGESVFLISALTCDGMTKNRNTLTAHGLDLILNMQTMIEIHQSDNANTIRYLTYELGRTAQADAPAEPGDAPEAPEAPTAPDQVENPGDAPVAPEVPTAPDQVENPGDAPVAPEAPTAPDQVENPGDAPEAPEAPTAPDQVENPGDAPVAPEAPTAPDRVENPGDAPQAPEAPTAPDQVENPGDAPVAPEAPNAPDPVEDPGNGPTDPGEFDQSEPEAPAPTERLEHAEKLDELEEKIEDIYIPDVPQPQPEPVALVDGDVPVPEQTAVHIVDEPVPLAKAPKTGDLSGVWALLSSLSLGGITLLNRKRKED